MGHLVVDVNRAISLADVIRALLQPGFSTLPNRTRRDTNLVSMVNLPHLLIERRFQLKLCAIHRDIQQIRFLLDLLLGRISAASRIKQSGTYQRITSTLAPLPARPTRTSPQLSPLGKNHLFMRLDLLLSAHRTRTRRADIGARSAG